MQGAVFAKKELREDHSSKTLNSNFHDSVIFGSRDITNWLFICRILYIIREILLATVAIRLPVLLERFTCLTSVRIIHDCPNQFFYSYRKLDFVYIVHIQKKV